MEKNVAGQRWIVFAFNRTTNVPLTGDAANITANLRIDGGAANAVDDVNPTELEDGYYYFDITQVESNGDLIVIAPASTTADIQVIGVPGAVYTTAPNFNAMGIETDGDLTQVNSLTGHTVQTGDTFAQLPTNFSDLSIEVTTGFINILQAAADKVWGTTTRAITDKAGFTISGTKTTLDALNDITAASVWAVGTRTLSSFGTLVADIWAYSSRTITGLTTAAILSIWNQATSALTTVGRIGTLLVDNINATISSRYSGGDITGDLSGSVGSVTGAVGSVTGAVASVAGNVDGNVTGSVGSLVGHTVQTGDNFARIGVAGAGLTDLGGMSTGMKAEVNVEADTALTDYGGLKKATQLTEGYSADGAAPTLEQALFEILQNGSEFSISGTTLTVKKRDGTTAAMTFTLDDATNPTSRTRAT